MKLRTFYALTLLALALPLAGCGLPSPGSSTSNRDIITADDIARTTAHTAYEVVQRLQPQWLNSRGNASIGGDESGAVTDSSAPVPDVYVNGIAMGDVEYLRNVLAQDVAEMRYYGPGEAGARFGMGHPRGVIAVTLK